MGGARRCWLVLVLICLGLTGWAAPSLAQEERPQAQALLQEAVEHLRAAASFKLLITQSGQPYPLALSFDGVNALPASLIGADAQFISPDELHIAASLRMFLPLSLDIYSRDDRQWLSFPSGAPWIALPAFAGFDVNRLLATNDGIEYALASLRDPQIIDHDATLDETNSWLIRGTAAGEVVSGLLFGFIEPETDVQVDVFINAETGRLQRIDIDMLLNADDPAAESSIWHIEFHAYDAPRDFEAPEL